jgi:septum site-determining protein MinD
LAYRIALVSGKGGSGKSTATAGLAQAFCAQGLRVLCVDCDIGLRSLDLLLGFPGDIVFSWADVLRGNCTLEQALRTRDTISLLPAPLATMEKPDGEAYFALLRRVSSDYDIVLLDAPAGFSVGFALAAAPADLALVVAQAEPVALRSAAVCVRDLHEAYPTLKVRLLLNRLHKKRVQNGINLNIDDAIDSVGAQLIGIIPEDEAVPAMLGKGKPLPDYARAAGAFARTARRVGGESLPLRID